MSNHGETTLEKITAAYAKTAERPGWDDLTPALPIAFIQIYFQGQRDALDEIARGRPVSLISSTKGKSND